MGYPRACPCTGVPCDQVLAHRSSTIIARPRKAGSARTARASSLGTPRSRSHPWGPCCPGMLLPNRGQLDTAWHSQAIVLQYVLWEHKTGLVELCVLFGAQAQPLGVGGTRVLAKGSLQAGPTVERVFPAATLPGVLHDIDMGWFFRVRASILARRSFSSASMSSPLPSSSSSLNRACHHASFRLLTEKDIPWLSLVHLPPSEFLSPPQPAPSVRAASFNKAVNSSYRGAV